MVFAIQFSLTPVLPNLLACSIGGALGSATGNYQPVIWKNRDAWGKNGEGHDKWKVIVFTHEADGDNFGLGDTWGDRFDYMAVGDLDVVSVDPVSQEKYPWAGSNEKGLALVQSASHNAKFDVLEDNIDGFLESDYDTDINGINIGPSYFARDNVTEEYVLDENGQYSAIHNDDKDLADPSSYSGYDWRANFFLVDNPDAPYPTFVDEMLTEVVDNAVDNSPDSNPDGVHDWEPSSSAVKRWRRIGYRMDTDYRKWFGSMMNYRYSAAQEIGLPTEKTLETLARNIGTLPYEGSGADVSLKSTGYHLNRFVTTFSVVITGTPPPATQYHRGKLTTMWVALGEPTLTVFIPIFPFSKEVPSWLDDIYQLSDAKRDLLYDTDGDDSEVRSRLRTWQRHMSCILRRSYKNNENRMENLEYFWNIVCPTPKPKPPKYRDISLPPGEE
jgi:hypothetical protein